MCALAYRQRLIRYVAKHRASERNPSYLSERPLNVAYTVQSIVARYTAIKHIQCFRAKPTLVFQLQTELSLHFPLTAFPFRRKNTAATIVVPIH